MTNTPKKIRIGSGAGFAGDLIEPALNILENGNLDYLCLECLAERTIASAQKERLVDSTKGYNPLLQERMEAMLPIAYKNKVKIITNMGAANPKSAMELTYKIACELKLIGLKIIAVIGDDIFSSITQYNDNQVIETSLPLSELQGEIVSANIYLGSDSIVEALKIDADIIITGRVSDCSLFLAPMIYAFNWTDTHRHEFGQGILAGHLLECGAQVTGGYYADSGRKVVPEFWNIGFPIVEMSENGHFCLEKLPNTGGIINLHTCTEQLLYEIHDPSSYITPDGIADFSNVNFCEINENCIDANGANTKGKPDSYKVSVGYVDSYIAEGYVSYSGFNCLERAILAGEIIKKKIDVQNLKIDELLIDYIGLNSTYLINKDLAIDTVPSDWSGNEIRLRIAGRAMDSNTTQKLCHYIEALYTNGPAGGGGIICNSSEIIAIGSILIPRDNVNTSILIKEVI